MTADRPVAVQLRAYVDSLLALGRARLAGLTLLVTLGTLAEGLGILILVPLTQILFGWALPGSRLGAIGAALIDRFGRETGLALLLTGFLALMLLRGAILVRRDLGLYVLSSELVDRWRGRMIAALVHAEWRALRALDRGDIEFAVTSDVNRLAIGSDRLLRGGVAVVQTIVLLAMAAQLAPMLALAAAAFLLPALPIGVRLARAAHRHGQALTGRGGARHGAFAEFMAGMKLAKAHRAEDRYADAFMALSDDLRARATRFARLQMASNALVQLLAAALAAALLWTGAVVLHTPPAILGAVLVLFARLPGPVLMVAQAAQALATMLPAIGGLVTLERRLAAAPEAGGGQAAPPPPCMAPAIRLSDVRLRHDPEVPLIEGIDLEIPAGALVVLLGPSGSGKTSLLDLIIGLTAPDAGRVSIDGAPLDDPRARAAWRRRIGYVPQDPFLFDRSLADNLRWAAPEASDAALWAALEAADAAAFVRARPAGLATRAGDRGGHFSGGERQRLCLARALLRDPALLALDEATSALDAESEARLVGALQALRGARTIVMIAHRLPPGLRPDRIIRLD
ncbi:MAG: ABC transporter ATP-binding protein/permease, partial [Sphingomonas sp.]|nr:ABC transporter ATP-binding protein/permease [Sphingomonas sp.]